MRIFRESINAPMCNRRTMHFIRAVEKHGKDDGQGHKVYELPHYEFIYDKGTHDGKDETVTIVSHDEDGSTGLSKRGTFTVGPRIEAEIWDLIGNENLGFIVCDECGLPTENGQYNEDDDVFACSDACMRKLVGDN